MEHPNQFQFDVFLSHNSQDKPRVRAIANRLKEEGFRIWFDEWSIELGEDIYTAVEKGLEVSQTLILCMSPNAFGSNWVELERSTVLFRDPSNRQRRFVPLYLEQCPIPETLKRFKYVDFRDHENWDLLLSHLKKQKGLSNPSKDPSNQ